MSSILARDRNASIQPSSNITADKLAQFFIEKVEGVRATTNDAAPPVFSSYSGHQLDHFDDVSIDDVRKVLTGSPPKSWMLDPLPTFLLLEVVDVLLPFIWVMVNASLQEGCLPRSQKAAIHQSSRRQMLIQTN